jgi:predicted small lipoprotein YifL
VRKFVILATLGASLAGCANHYLPLDQQECDRLADWNDRKACKEKRSTEEREWEKRPKQNK